MASQLLAQREIVTPEHIKTIFCDSNEASRKFEAYKAQFEETHGELPEMFIPCPAAFKRKTVTKMNSVKLGSDFEVKILNPNAEIEKGFDSDKECSFVKLFFK